ncbi:hypothetical protein VPH35_036929 [Triticum aestivum]
MVRCGVRGDTRPARNAVGMVNITILETDHLYRRRIYGRTKECGIDYPENGLLPPDAQSWCQASFDPKQLLWSADQTSMTLDISKSNTGDAASKQDSAFKKENDVAKPPPSDLENRT